MSDGNILESATNFAKDYLHGAEAGHNWWHICRVRNIAMKIHRIEKSGDIELIELAAILHDIGDHKTGKGGNGPEIIREFLEGQHFEAGKIQKIITVIENISFRDSFNNNTVKKCLDLGKGMVQFLTISRDFKTILYSHLDNYQSDIYMVENLEFGQLFHQ